MMVVHTNLQSIHVNLNNEQLQFTVGLIVQILYYTPTQNHKSY